MTLPYFDRPRELRRSVRTRVQIAAKYVSDNLVVEGVVTDVSADGLFFCSDYLDGTGETVRISLDVPWRNGPLELRGEVRWVNDTPSTGGMGIKFIDVRLEDRMVLSSLGLSALANDAVSLSSGDA
jgi:PilZ domain